MKKLSTAHCVRKMLLSAVAVAVMTSPLLAAASSRSDSVSDDQNTMTTEGEKRLYKELKYKSRKICGPTGIKSAGSLERATANKECYEDTLAIAVLRLDTPAITALHQE